MAKPKVNWHEWVAPGAMLAIVAVGVTIFGCQLNGIENRLSGLDEKIDRRGEAIENRLSQTNSRLDSGLDKQSEIGSKLDKMEVDFKYVRDRLDRMERVGPALQGNDVR